MDKIFKLYACCVSVKGARRSVICDLQRMDIEFIPNALYEILTSHKNRSLSVIKREYNNIHDDIIDEYIDFLITKGFGFWCDSEDVELFPEINLHWDRPSLITNAIIDISDNSAHNFETISEELNYLGCEAIEMRFFCDKNIEQLKLILEKFCRGKLRHIDLILKYNQEIQIQEYEQLYAQYQMIFSIILHSSPEENLYDFTFGHVQTKKKVLISSDHCGVVNSSFFYANIDLFTESQQYNSCLNRKISIDVNGEIKNCPSLSLSYGNISDTSLQSALAHKNFKDLWEINKDQIDICRDCEFRYVCTDCRAYISDTNDIYSKPSKCSYDPYTATWK